MMVSEKSFLNLIKSSFASSNDSIILSYGKAKEYFAGKNWIDGKEYINHIAMVAKMLIDYGLDSDTIIASLIYQAYLMGKITLKQIKDEYGESVEGLIKGCAKTASMNYNKQGENAGELESVRQMLLALGKDIRVIFIIICERYQTLLFIDNLDNNTQIEICKETMDIFVPLIERLGMGSIKSEMEDICFKHLNPKVYHELEDELNKKYKKRVLIMKEANSAIEEILLKLGIHGEVTSRFKHFYSVYKKLDKGGMDKIYDIIALRVIVPEIKDCYSVLGEIHSVYKPVPGRIKDYIASPKPNGYRSLHTTLLSKDGVPFEVQVRTKEMHEICEYGLAA
ncbi:MAG: bifunctional (p)ppGpp synthetase/guanosine-3',5'-bis(diphosphate) 3'-pyrophosphohydrolase, partial [Clostridia bacterium]|nr:bifunctional (p)ppGpp synthetase/guanosine-3',5'-bis(diphosphate) 3'-pyrophosphohydrolase [Clostridia bacterium]